MNQVTAEGELDGSGHLILPTFINIHTHLDKAFLSEQITNESGTIVPSTYTDTR